MRSRESTSGRGKQNQPGYLDALNSTNLMVTVIRLEAGSRKLFPVTPYYGYTESSLDQFPANGPALDVDITRGQLFGLILPSNWTEDR